MNTEISASEYKFQRLSHDVSNRLEVVGQLASGIAHEINTPVQYVSDNLKYVSGQIHRMIELIHRYQGLSDLIQNDAVLHSRYLEIQKYSAENDVDFLIEEVPAALAESITGVETIAGIVRSINSLVYPGSREQVDTDVNETIIEAVSLSRGKWRKSLDLTTDLEENLPLVKCYAGELGQVLVNLIINATDAIEETSKKGRVQIRSFLYKNSVGIQVEDTGNGIPLEIQHRIFDPFFTSKTVGKGTGQGLAFAHSSIVERNGGTLFFETAEGEGTTFHIYLPIN